MPNLPPPGTALLTVSWDTVVGETCVSPGDYDEPAHYEPITIGAQVIEALTNRLLDEVRREVKLTVQQHLAEAIKDQVSGIVTETLTGEIRMTNHWGETTGKPTTLREMIATQAKEFITAKPKDRYSHEKVSNFAELLKAEVTDAMTKELQQTILQARQQVAEAVKVRAGELLGGVINSTAPRR